MDGGYIRNLDNLERNASRWVKQKIQCPFGKISVYPESAGIDSIYPMVNSVY